MPRHAGSTAAAAASMLPAADAVLRWAVNISIWEPEPQEWAFLLELLPEAERADVERFKFDKDKQRALVSRCVAITLVAGLRDQGAWLSWCC